MGKSHGEEPEEPEEPAFLYMADRTGLEPATSGVTGRHSNQLNYRSNGRMYISEVVGDDGIEPPTLCL